MIHRSLVLVESGMVADKQRRILEHSGWLLVVF